ncbi:hypothetical protein [Flammeovirga sp. OC4]|uniref:hypothetical protein n=1 Tax=Flammeovirga sp. OC4 TaxID=1382345 RepID=UPI0005C50AD6|nr:hypothetical protein [Flammeovirga sp. OC4]
MNKQTIFVISNEPWGDLWFSKQHYANELSKLGHSVYFVNAPKRWNIKHLLDWSVKVNKIKKNLHTIDFVNPFPIRFFSGFFLFLNDLINSYKLRSITKDEEIIFWQFDHNRFVRAPFLKFKKKIYHIADPYMGAKNDVLIAKCADLIICTSDKYLRHYKEITKQQNVIYIPHGISEDEGVIDLSKVENYKSKYGNYVLFIGTINHDVDLGIFESIIKKYKLLVIGKVLIPSSRWEELHKHQNFIYLGIVHAQQLKDYIAGAFICITAYRFDLQKTGANRSPLKILNYLRQYKSIIVSTDSELEELEGKVIFKARNYQHFLELISQHKGELLNHHKVEINNYLEKHKYPKLIEQILQCLNKK